MESEVKDNEEIKEIGKYRENYLDYILDKYTNNGSPDFLIDMKTLKVIRYEDTRGIACLWPKIVFEPWENLYALNDDNFQKQCLIEKKFVTYQADLLCALPKDTEPTYPSYGTLTTYYCEPAQRLLGKLDYLQKELLECEEESATDLSTDTSETAESSQESFTEPSSDEGFAQQSPREVNEYLMSKYIPNNEIDASKMKYPICDLSFRKDESNVFEKDLNISQEKSNLDFSLLKDESKIFKKDLNIRQKKSNLDLSLLKYESKVFKKDFNISQKKSKLGKPNYITGRKNPAFKQDTSFLHSMQVDDLSPRNSFSESSNSINCSNSSINIYYVKNKQTVQEQKTKKRKLED